MGLEKDYNLYMAIANASEKILSSDGKLKFLIEDETLRRLIDDYQQSS